MKKNAIYFESIGEKFEIWSDDYDVQQRRKLFSRLFMASGVDLEGTKQLNALEVGCGFGGMTEFFVQHLQNLTVMDISEGLSKATANKFDLQHMTADVTEMSATKNKWDIIVSSECIEHSSSPQKALEEMYRSLNLGGLLIVSTPNSLWKPVLRIGQLVRIRRFNDRELFISPRDVNALVNRLGGEVIYLDGCHFFPWQIPFAKPVLRLLDAYAKKLYFLTINFGFVIKKTSNRDC
jgi:2-polyprenyl-6-hydroxyphenyl methylase/3-demethylubiquinone-9 3-methyltransferase